MDSGLLLIVACCGIHTVMVLHSICGMLTKEHSPSGTGNLCNDKDYSLQ